MEDKDRKLTEAELRRKESFDRLCDDLAAQGYETERLTVGIVAANVLAIAIALPIDILLGIGFFALHPQDSLSFGLIDAAIIILAFIALIVVHELIHGLVWGLYAKKHWTAISFGFIVQYFTPYCTCSEPLPRHAYIIGALAPTIVLGIAPILIAWATGSAVLFAIGALMVIGGGGDMLIVLKMLRFKPKEKDVLYLDHPYELGLVVFMR